jgi:hypothetical protein
MSREGRRRRELARQERQRLERERRREMQQQESLPLHISRRQLFADFIREFKWTIIKSLPLGVILPMSIFFGSVGPDDYAKNYAAWARKFGLADQAEWLSLHINGPRVFWAAFLVSLIYLAIAFVIPALIRRAKTDRAAIIVPMLVAAVVVVALYGQYEVLSANSDRHLNEYQRAKLKETLSPVASKFSEPIKVAAHESDPESTGYAIEIMIVFSKAGLKVASTNQRLPVPFRMAALDTKVRGVFFQVLDAKHIPAEVELLRGALKNADINSVLYNNPDLRDTDYALVVDRNDFSIQQLLPRRCPRSGDDCI